MSDGFNPSLLQLARKYRRLSQKQVAESAGLDQGHYSRIENDLLPEPPSSQNIQKLGSALGLPVEFFHLPDSVSGLPLSVHPMHRKKASVGEKALQSLHAELNIRLIHLRRLFGAVEFEPEVELPWIDVDEGGGPEAVAETVRRSWRIPPGPFKNLTHAVERAGALVICCDLEAGIDGVTLQSNDLPPCIFLNRRVPPDRMRFSLAHELGHVVMHRIPTDQIEDEANAFARYLLLPRKDIRKDFVGKVNLEKLIRLKAVWRVSIQLLLHHATQIGGVTPNQSQYLWRQISKLGWRTREPKETDFPYEEPQVFPEIIGLHTTGMSYSVDELCKLLCATQQDLGRLYGIWDQSDKASYLKLVK